MAKVNYNKGAVINLGNYESTRVQVGIELDCENNEVGERMKEAIEIVSEIYTEEVKKALETKKKRRITKSEDK